MVIEEDGQNDDIKVTGRGGDGDGRRGGKIVEEKDGGGVRGWGVRGEGGRRSGGIQGGGEEEYEEEEDINEYNMKIKCLLTQSRGTVVHFIFY